MALDPSGAFAEGKGTTGWCFMSTTPVPVLIESGIVSAKYYSSAEEYWDAHIQLIKRLLNTYITGTINMIVIIEDFLLYADKAKSQTHSHFETVRLIGVLQHWLWSFKIPYRLQTASEVKCRWTDDILIHKGYLVRNNKRLTFPGGSPVISHTVDAIRHAIHFDTFKNKECNNGTRSESKTKQSRKLC